MISAGILDPAKVTRSALQNAASIAGLMLTTEALVSEIPEAEKAAIRPVVANHRCTNRTVKFRPCELSAGLSHGNSLSRLQRCPSRNSATKRSH
jgi:hypothetical protein